MVEVYTKDGSEIYGMAETVDEIIKEWYEEEVLWLERNGEVIVINKSQCPIIKLKTV